MPQRGRRGREKSRFSTDFPSSLATKRKSRGLGPRARLEKVADLAQKRNVFRSGGGRGGFRRFFGRLLVFLFLQKLRRFALELHAGGRDHLDEPEDDEGQKEEVDDRREEGPVAEDRGARGGEGFVGFRARVAFGSLQNPKEVREVRLSDEETHDRVDDVLDKARDDAVEGGADDHGDGEVEHVAAADEGLKFSEKLFHKNSVGGSDGKCRGPELWRRVRSAGGVRRRYAPLRRAKGKGDAPVPFVR